MTAALAPGSASPHGIESVLPIRYCGWASYGRRRFREATNSPLAVTGNQYVHAASEDQRLLQESCHTPAGCAKRHGRAARRARFREIAFRFDSSRIPVSGKSEPEFHCASIYALQISPGHF